MNEGIVKGNLVKGLLTYIDSFEIGEIGLEESDFKGYYFDPKDIEKVIKVERMK